MIKSSALADEGEFLSFMIDSKSLNIYLTKFASQCINASYDEECACGVCWQVFEQRQQNGSFESCDFSTIVEGCSWVNIDENNKKYPVYGLKIYFTTSDKRGVVWEKIQNKIETKFGNENKGWKELTKTIADIRERRGLSSKLILNELNKIKKMPQELKKEIEAHLKQWDELVKKERQPKTESELQKNCVCLEIKKNTKGEIYGQCQKYNNNQLQENGSNEWKIYFKNEYKYKNPTHVIYFEEKSRILSFLVYIYELLFGSAEQNEDKKQFQVKPEQNSTKDKKINEKTPGLSLAPLISSDINKEENKSYN